MCIVSLQLIPLYQCYPTPFEEVKALLEQETGRPLDEMFSDFNRDPVGVASLAQVHIATDRATGRKVAVKIQVSEKSYIMFCSTN